MVLGDNAGETVKEFVVMLLLSSTVEAKVETVLIWTWQREAKGATVGALHLSRGEVVSEMELVKGACRTGVVGGLAEVKEDVAE